MTNILNLHRRLFLYMAVAILSIVFSPGLFAADDFPEKPVTVIVAWSAGGATDSVTRAIEPAFAKALGVNIVVKNITGAAGTIGTAQAAAARADGYTVLITPAGPVTTQPHLRTIPYSLQSFEHIGRITSSDMLMMVSKESGIKSLKDVMKKAKGKPGKIKFASTGAGTLPHISILALDDLAGIKSRHIPFKGSANAVKALLGGVVDVYSDQAQLVPKFDLLPIAAWASNRLPDYPNVPTLKELGYDYQMSNWVGMFVPKGTPAAVKSKLEAALEKALQADSSIELLSKLKLTPSFLNQADFSVFTAKIYQENGQHLEKAGLIGSVK